MTIKAEQKLAAVAVSIKPIQTAPIDISFFNGNQYTGSDGQVYPGYTPIVIGEISTNEEDDNYISPETFEKWAIDAYYDIDAYVNKAMSVLGMFNEVSNFSSIPVITKDHMMRAIAAKIEQNLWTNPSNAETRVTLTQSSGGRTTNTPSRENFNPSDLLNEKVREYINGSEIFEILADSFEAIVLDRNEYYTKDEIDAIISSGRVPIEVLYTKNLDTYEPINPGDGVNKKYVDAGDAYIQEQINALVIGDVQLKTFSVTATNPALESYSGLAQDQNEINLESAAITRILNNRIVELTKKIGTPLSAYKSLVQYVSNTPTDIIDYDELDNGTIDSLEGFDVALGTYRVQEETKGDLISFAIQMKVTGQSSVVSAGKLYLYRNGLPMIHPVTGLPIEASIKIDTIAGTQVSIATVDMAVRDAGTDGEELKVGDELKLVVEQSDFSAGQGSDLQVSDVVWDMIYKRAASNELADVTSRTSNVIVDSPATESITGEATSQLVVNTENRAEFERLGTEIDRLDAKDASQDILITDNATAITNLDNDKVDQVNFDAVRDNLQEQINANDADISNLANSKADITYVDQKDSSLQTQIDGLAQAIGDAGTWTGEVAKEYVDAGDAALQAQIDNLEANAAQIIVDDVANLLMPIGTILLGVAQPTFGTWQDLGQLSSGQAIIGGDTSDGAVKAHTHNIGYVDNQYYINPDAPQSYDQDSSINISYTVNKTGLRPAGPDRIDFDVYDPNLTALEAGPSQNKAWGLGVGSQVHLWKRTA